MSKQGKIVYFFIALFFMIVLNNYVTSLLLKNINKINNSLFEIIYIQNNGAAFSLFQNSKVFLIFFALSAICVFVYSILKNIEKISTITLFCSSMLISGIYCNMYERLTFGFVRDFIKLNFIDFPVFNVSDVFINIGVFVIIFIIIKENYKR